MMATSMGASVALFIIGAFLGVAAGITHPADAWRWLLAASAVFVAPFLFRLWTLAILGG